jgi:cholesterol oxidase
MKGFVTFGEQNFNSGFEQGKKSGTSFMFHLTIRTEDIEFFVRDPKHQGTAEGYVNCPALGGELPVEKGEFECFVDADGNNRTMDYRLFFRDRTKRPLTLSGRKRVRHDGIEHIWRDTSTLYSKILEGHVEAGQEEKIAAAGVLHILPLDFAHQMTTFQATAPSFGVRAKAIGEFGKFFLGTLWDVYRPKVGTVVSHAFNEREIPLYSLEGVKNAEITTHPFSTADKLGLSMLRFNRAPSDDVVVLMHGLTTSTDMFIMPEHYNLVSYLLDHGFTDVFSLDWRGSMRFTYDLFPTRFCMDDIALYDMPAAFSTLRKIVGPERRIHVICHCVGSITFMMSLYAGLLDGITSVISNSVSLTPRVPRWSSIKLSFAPFLMNWILRWPNLNPRWSYMPGPGIPQGKILAKLISLGHPECDVPACHMASFMWGSGRPAVWLHENLEEVTHRRTGDLFGAVNINYYLQIIKMARKQLAIKMFPNDPRYDQLPDNYMDRAAEVETPVLFVTGDTNRVFMDSNVIAYNTLKQIKPDNRNELKIFPGYGHQDVFMGKNNHADVFPVFVDFLERQRTNRVKSAPA